MRFRILHTFFYPDKSAVSQILTDLAFHLSQAGHRVDVISSRGDYEGGSTLPPRESVNGVSVRRIWSPSLGKKSALARIADLGSYAIGSTMRALFARRADCVIVLTNPPMYAFVGMLLRLIRRESYIYVVMDLYPDIAVQAGMLARRSPLRYLAAWLTRLTLKCARSVVVLGECMAGAVEKYGVPREKIEIIRNWGDDGVQPLEPQENPLRAELGYRDEFVVMYSGNMGIGHRFDDILQVALELRDNKDIRFLFVGGGVRRGTIEKFRQEHQLDNIIVRSYFPREQLACSLPVGDAHFVSLREGFEGLIVPSKPYGVMAAGRPIIYQGSANGEIARMLTQQGGGQVVAEGDHAGLKDLIVRWAANRAEAQEVGRRGREVFKCFYTRQIGLKRYTQVLEGGGK